MPYYDGPIKLWRVLDGSLLRTLRSAHKKDEKSVAVAFSPDGRLLASSDFWDVDDIKLWRIPDGRLLRTSEDDAWEFDKDRGWVAGYHCGAEIAFSPDGQLVASCRVKLWSISTIRFVGTFCRFKSVRTLTGHTDRVCSVAFSPDGQFLASAGCDRTIKLWQVLDGSLVHTLAGHTDGVTSVAFSPDGQLVASASGDRTIKLWWALAEELLCTLEGHTDCVNSVAFSPNGLWLASGSHDGTACLWRIGDAIPA